MTETLAPNAAGPSPAEQAPPTSLLPEAPSETAALLELHRPVGDFTNLHDVAGALTDVPMIGGEEIREATTSYGAGEASIIEDATVPMSRIVGVGSFETWAGRGIEDGNIVQNGDRSSLSAVAESAQLGQMTEYLGYGKGSPVLELFQDTDGEVWAFISEDGSHRTAGAKVRGDTELNHAVVKTREVLPSVNFSVHDRLAKERGWSATAQGEAVLRAYATQLAQGSEALDASLQADRARMVPDANGEIWI